MSKQFALWDDYSISTEEQWTIDGANSADFLAVLQVNERRALMALLSTSIGMAHAWFPAHKSVLKVIRENEGYRVPAGYRVQLLWQSELAIYITQSEMNSRILKDFFYFCTSTQKKQTKKKHSRQKKNWKQRLKHRCVLTHFTWLIRWSRMCLSIFFSCSCVHICHCLSSRRRVVIESLTTLDGFHLLPSSVVGDFLTDGCKLQAIVHCDVWLFKVQWRHLAFTVSTVWCLYSVFKRHSIEVYH